MKTLKTFGPSLAGRGSPRRGIAMVAAMITVFTAGALVSIVLTLAHATNKDANVAYDQLRAKFLAEGALEVATKETQHLIANWDLPVALTEDSVTIDGVDVAFTIEPNGYIEAQFDDSGILNFMIGYELSASAAVGDSVYRMQRIINAQATPIFQFAVFYTDDLEVSNGPNMTLGGRVHTNRNMYLSPNHSTLTMDTNYIHAVGSIYRHRKNSVAASNGTVSIRKWVSDPFNSSEPSVYVDMLNETELAAEGFPSVSGYDSNFVFGIDGNGDGDYVDPSDMPAFVHGSLDMWAEPETYTGGSGNTVLTGDHGLGEAVTPDIGSIQLFEETEPGDGTHALDPETGLYVPSVGGDFTPGFFHKHAGLKLLKEPGEEGSYELKAYLANGTDVTEDLVSTGAIYLSEIYDARQADETGNEYAMVTVIEVDMSILNTSPHFPTNGLMYAGDYGAGEGTDTGGMKVVNGAELAGKLTMVSQSSIYVEGDFNTINKTGASAIGDAVNLLSNDWDDSKAKGDLPVASDTTFNLALITGNKATEPGSYSGGLENLPRFHENWSGKKATINGSFVNTWQSQFATGAWKYGSDRYTAPIRDWNYDESFNNFGNLPPFTPLAVTAEPVVTW